MSLHQPFKGFSEIVPLMGFGSALSPKDAADLAAAFQRATLNDNGGVNISRRGSVLPIAALAETAGEMQRLAGGSLKPDLGIRLAQEALGDLLQDCGIELDPEQAPQLERAIKTYFSVMLDEPAAFLPANNASNTNGDVR